MLRNPFFARGITRPFCLVTITKESIVSERYVTCRLIEV
jgi:hypothetical protein